MVVTTRGARDVMDALASGVFLTPDENAKAYGEVVWSWRRDAGAKLVELSASDGDNKPAHRGEHEVSRKAIAQGMSECFRCPVCSCAPNVQFLAHETAGAARTRHSLRPLFGEGQRICKSSGKTCRENANVCPPSLRANGSRECAPDDRLREAIHFAAKKAWIASSLALLAMTAGGASCDKFNTTAAPGRSLLTRRSPPSDEGGWRSRGKSLRVFGNRVKPQNQKYFASQFCKSEL